MPMAMMPIVILAMVNTKTEQILSGCKQVLASAPTKVHRRKCTSQVHRLVLASAPTKRWRLMTGMYFCCRLLSRLVHMWRVMSDYDTDDDNDNANSFELPLHAISGTPIGLLLCWL